MMKTAYIGRINVCTCRLDVFCLRTFILIKFTNDNFNFVKYKYLLQVNDLLLRYIMGDDSFTGSTRVIQLLLLFSFCLV